MSRIDWENRRRRSLPTAPDGRRGPTRYMTNQDKIALVDWARTYCAQRQIPQAPYLSATECAKALTFMDFTKAEAFAYLANLRSKLMRSARVCGV